MRLTCRGTHGCALASSFVLLASGCFDGGAYQGGGRQLEPPGFLDVAADIVEDRPVIEDAIGDHAREADAMGRSEEASTDTWLDLPRSEPPPDVDDAGPTDAPPVDEASVDGRTDVPYDSPDASEPRDAADAPLRDVPVEPRRD